MSMPPLRRKTLAWLLLVPVCGAVLVLSGCAESASMADDAKLVFCLDADQQANLAAAAVALGLVTGTSAQVDVVVNGHPITVMDWRRNDPAAFDRACSALVSSRSAAAPAPAADASLVGTLYGLVSLVTGAGIGLLTGAYRDSVIRRRTQAGTLQAITLQFVQTGDTFIQEWATRGRATPAAGPLRDVRWKLVLELRSVANLYHRWSGAVGAVQALAEGDLGEPLLHGWESLSDQARLTRMNEARDQWIHLTWAIDEIATALRRPIWQRSVPRTLTPAITGDGARPGIAGAPP